MALPLDLAGDRYQKGRHVSRYETFVIRLWIEDGHGLDHGEVTHLTSGRERRFLKVEQAMQFIREMAEKESESGAPRDSERDMDRLLIDFGSTSSKG